MVRPQTAEIKTPKSSAETSELISDFFIFE